MAKLFVSYSRVDIAFVERLYRRLQGMRPQATIWYDKAPHGLLGGDNWWDQIMQAIADCDVFIYVLSNESVQSKYCQAEFEEARRLQKRIITIQARDRTKLTNDLRDIQYVDMKNGVDDPDALVSLTAALDRQLGLAKKRRPLWKPQTPKPGDDNVPQRPANAPEVDTPTLQRPQVEKEKPADTPPWWQKTEVWVPILVVFIAGIFGLWQGVFANNPDGGTTPNPVVADEASLVPTDDMSEDVGTALLPSETPDGTGTADAENRVPTETLTNTVEPSQTQTDTPEPTPTPTEEPTVDIVGVGGNAGRTGYGTGTGNKHRSDNTGSDRCNGNRDAVDGHANSNPHLHTGCNSEHCCVYHRASGSDTDTTGAGCNSDGYPVDGNPNRYPHTIKHANRYRHALA